MTTLTEYKWLLKHRNEHITLTVKYQVSVWKVPGLNLSWCTYYPWFYNHPIKLKANEYKFGLTCQCWQRGQDYASPGADGHSQVQTPSVYLAVLTPEPGASPHAWIHVHHSEVALGSFQVAHQQPARQHKHAPLHRKANTRDNKEYKQFYI